MAKKLDNADKLIDEMIANLGTGSFTGRIA